MGQRRYPGATPFTKDQAKIFYGRNNDIKNLLTMVRVEQKVLLYSKSGLGKTSLLEAGVIPELPKNYIPVSIRFYAKRKDSLSPVQGVLTALENKLGKMEDMPPSALDELETSENDRKALWYYFKKLQLSQASDPDEEEPEATDTDDDADDEEIETKLPKTYVLVFDQFEELFSYSRAEINEFKQQFYELTEQNVPERYAELIAPARRKNREKFNRKALSEIHRKTNVKTIFAIRSDRLSLLNQLSDKITDIQQIYYEIKPLSNNQAQEAIVNPAKLTSADFVTSPYKFHSDAIKKIISELTKKESGTENIETTQLQIVCHRIEEIAEQKQKDLAEQKKKNPSDSDQVEIQVGDLPNFKNIFLDFYKDSIEKLEEGSRDKAKRMIEDELIRSKQRISLDENICKEFLNGDELKMLVDTHLLRAEQNSFGRFSFELSHDTLVEPILESKNKYLDDLEKKRLLEEQEAERLRVKKEREEERIRLLQEKEEERKRLEKEKQEEIRKLKEKQEQEKKIRELEEKKQAEIRHLKEQDRLRKMKRQRMMSRFFIIFSLVAVVLLYFAYSSYQTAEKQKLLALENQQKAVNLFVKNTKQEVKNSKDNAQASITSNDYEGAIVHFQNAKRIIIQLNTGSIISYDSSKNVDVAGGIFGYAEKIFSVGDQKKNTIMDMVTFSNSVSDSIIKIKKDTISINKSIDEVMSKMANSGKIKQLTNKAIGLRENKKYVRALQVYDSAYMLDDTRGSLIDAYNATIDDAIDDYKTLYEFYQNEVKNTNKAAWANSKLQVFQQMEKKQK